MKFRANIVSSNEVLGALEAVHKALVDVASNEGLDEKLAEYTFFPLSQVFNEAQRISARCVELALKSLHILIEKGWRSTISPQMGKQLLILMNIISGGTPNQNQGQSQSTAATVTRPRSEELTVAAYDCVSALCVALRSEEAAASIFNEIGATTVVDHTVYVLLEGIVDGSADETQLSAARALQSLHRRITDRVVMASLLPRTVSSIVKVLRSTHLTRRSYRVLRCCLDILNHDLKFTLDDFTIAAAKQENDAPTKPTATDSITLDDSWVRATASQVKVALASVIRLRSHDKQEVRQSLLGLCLMVIESCPVSLSDSLPMMVETVVVLSDSSSSYHENGSYNALKHVITSSDTALSSLKSSLHSWTVALPRVMQSADDLAKQNVIKQIGTAFQALSETQVGSGIIGEAITTSLHDSVSVVVQSSSSKMPLTLESPMSAALENGGATGDITTDKFRPILLEQQSQKQTLLEIHSMIRNLSQADTSLTIANSMLNKLHRTSGDSQVASFWLALEFLKSTPTNMFSLDDVLELGPATSLSKAALVEELYSISLPILVDLQSTNPENWRTSALALEGVALEAEQLGDSFRPELIEALYPVLQLISSSNPSLRNHAITCLNIITTACSYPNTSTMLIDNVDYLINSVALKLNTFDISPQAPQVLLMMMRLCGARLIPYLDDLIGSIFAALDAFHGYPKLVELLFTVLGGIVDEGVKTPTALAISFEGKEPDSFSWKRSYFPRTISDLASDLKRRRAARNRATLSESLDPEPHPNRPWSSALDDPDKEQNDTETDSQVDPQEPQEQEEEKPLSKPHELLLSIIKSVPPHLSSPSPVLRRSLLSILARGLPVLSHHENSFLPLINDIWPSVSGRVTLPKITKDEHSASATVDDMGVREETFVTVACCTAIGTMCRGAGDFMSSRIEHEFARWKKVYIASWDQVHRDAEKTAERQRQRQRQRQLIQETSSISRVEDITAKTTSTISTNTSTPNQSLRPLPGTTSKSFTPHNSIWKSLTTLFITILSQVRLPADTGDEICRFLGQWITYFYPEIYFTYSWQQNSDAKTSLPGEVSDPAELDDGRIWDDNGIREAERAIRAMDAWNADLTWYIFAAERPRNGVDSVNGMSERVAGLEIESSGHADDGWQFAELVF